MGKLKPQPKYSHRRRQVAAVNPYVNYEPSFDPWNECLCDLDYEYVGPLRPLYHPENGQTTDHQPDCRQLRTTPSETGGKQKSPDRRATYEDPGEDEEGFWKAGMGKENALSKQEKATSIRHTEAKTRAVEVAQRRKLREAKAEAKAIKAMQREEARNDGLIKVEARIAKVVQREVTRRIREAKAEAKAMKTVKPAAKPFVGCYCYDATSNSEDQAIRNGMRVICRSHTDGTMTFHLPSFPAGRSDHIGSRQFDSPKSGAPIDLLEKEWMKIQKRRKLIVAQKETMGGVRKKTKDARDEKTEARKRKEHKENKHPPKSAAFIDLEEEDEEVKGEDVRMASAAGYDPRTIVTDFLRATGEHPYLPPLNSHVEGFSAK